MRGIATFGADISLPLTNTRFRTKVAARRDLPPITSRMSEYAKSAPLSSRKRRLETRDAPLCLQEGLDESEAV
jgi:hypothetical protein